MVKKSGRAVYRSLDPVKWRVEGGFDITRWKDIGSSTEGSREVWPFMIFAACHVETWVSLFSDSIPVIGRVQQTKYAMVCSQFSEPYILTRLTSGRLVPPNLNSSCIFSHVRIISFIFHAALC
jgi:hypothetical protein